MAKEDELNRISNFNNFVIIGGGPAGLTAGIVATRNGYKAVILEKGEIVGPKPRGEGLKKDPLIDEILGKDFLELNSCIKNNGDTIIHSPGDLNHVELKLDPIYFIEWRKYINRFVEILQELEVKILLNSEVIEPIEKDNICIGVKYKDKNGDIQQIYGNVILDCSGHSAVLGRYYGIPYDIKINCPIIKCIISEANIDIDKTQHLHVYIIGNGDLNYAPNFPPCTAFAFSKGGKNMEVGLMLYMRQAIKMKTVNIPSDDEIMMVWDKLKQNYPGFSEFLKDARIDYEELTAISNARLVKHVLPKAGVVLIGESAGFVDPFGSSGLYSSMEMANFFVKMLSRKLDYITDSNSTVSKHKLELWSYKNINEYKKQWNKDPSFKHIKKSYFQTGIFYWYILKKLRTSEKINKRWNRISWLFRRA